VSESQPSVSSIISIESEFIEKLDFGDILSDFALAMLDEFSLSKYEILFVRILGPGLS